MLAANNAVQKGAKDTKSKHERARELSQVFDVPKFNWTHEPDSGINNDH